MLSDNYEKKYMILIITDSTTKKNIIFRLI